MKQAASTDSETTRSELLLELDVQRASANIGWAIAELLVEKVAELEKLLEDAREAARIASGVEKKETP